MVDLNSLVIERVDDVPLLFAELKRMKVASLVDRYFPTHGGWEGISQGEVVVVWLAHLLSEGDHRLNQVEFWVDGRQELIRRCLGTTVVPGDVADDRLAAILRKFAEDRYWQPFEATLTGSLLRTYALPVTTVRVDMTTASTYRATAEGLFQRGHSKDGHPELPQVKIALATLDPLGMPLVTTVVAGNRADDPLYAPVIAQVRTSVGQRGLLYVGDCKMAAVETRGMLAAGDDFYLCPLSSSQLPPTELDAALQAVRAGTQPLQVLLPGPTAAAEPVAEGFEVSEDLTVTVAGATVTWSERRLFAHSPERARSENAALHRRLDAAKEALLRLNERGHGKRRYRDPAKLAVAVAAILRRYQVSAWIRVSCEAVISERTVRGYRGAPTRIVAERDHRVGIAVDAAAVQASEQRLGWRVYATNAAAERLPSETVITVYRDQYQIERGIGRLKGKPLSLTPMYLRVETHVVGLIRLLGLALRLLCLVEYQVRQALAATGESLTGLYAGQAKRQTSRPTTEALLRAFRDVNLALLYGESARILQRHLTVLTPLQQRILELLGLPADTYSKLARDSLHVDSL
jgi:transposase